MSYYIWDYDVHDYVRITPESFIRYGLALALEPVYTVASMEDDTKPGHRDHRLVQVLSIDIQPHRTDGLVHGGYDYLWSYFDFVTKRISEVTCWGAGPALYLFLDPDPAAKL